MPARLYLRPQPRAFFLLTETHALVFRQPGAGETKAARSVVVAEFVPLDEVDTNGLIAAGRGSSASVEGVLGVTSVPSDRSPIPEVFLLLLSTSTPLAPLIPGSPLRPSKVVSVEFHSLTSNFWDTPGLEQAGAGGAYDDFDDYVSSSGGYNSSQYSRTGGSGGVQTQSQASLAGIEDPCAGMKKYLESGGFFHAHGCRWDISRRLGLEGTNVVQAERGHAHPLEGFDERFVWNANLLAPFLAFRAGLPASVRQELDSHALLLPIIQGFVGSNGIATGSWNADNKPDLGAIALISRLSCKRAGARFRTRGIDDDGNVANFVETETILTAGETSLSYTQVRGSVPLFWQQPQQGLGTLQQRVEITRPPQATQPAFDKHFMDLLDRYGAVNAINLLGQKDAEAMLSAAYQDHFAALVSVLDHPPPNKERAGSPVTEPLVYTPYDFHAAVRLGGHDAVRNDLNASREVTRSMNQFGITAVDKVTGDAIELQHGVFRTNCLDCLDRTNYVQEVLCSIALRRFLAAHGSVLLNSPALWAAHRELWADNGDRLSKTYAGTGAINTSATRTGRKTLAGLLSDATKSVGRAYINNFQDKAKQTAIDMLLGLMAGQRPVLLFDPIGDSVQSALSQRKAEYSVPRDMVFFSGTWNVNGKPADEPLNPWLFPDNTPKADIYAIAFQEIVELTPQQIVQTDPGKKRKWEIAIMHTFESVCGKDEYILMRSEQLVGTALMVVVKASLLPHIRNVEYADKKTGLQGLSGNKGGVGIRFNLYDATVCLMTCHLAAGQSNYADRNADYRTIANGLTFLRGKTIDSHDIVIWAADFNYRIDLPNDEVRDFAAADQLQALYNADQLAMARDDAEVFEGYTEGPITFRPTYKYDNGTDTYDSSEKQRIPAWTDRVLYKGQLKIIAYNRAELRTSDHQPVYAVLQGTVAEVDEAKKARVADELVSTIRANGGGKLDERVEQASQGGVRSLVKEMTNVSLAPSPNSSRTASPVPRRGPAPPITRDTKPPRRPSLQATTATTVNVINSAYERLGIPPPLPPRHSVSGTSSNGNTVPAVIYEARKRAPPPPPTDFKRIGLPPPATAPEEEEMTPVATGDFVLVQSPNAPTPDKRPPPPLPTRSAAAPSSSSGSVAALASKFATPIHAAYTTRQQPPKPKPQTSLPPPLPVRPAAPEKGSTLDMDASPPDNLIAPVAPDNSLLKAKPKPAVPERKMSAPVIVRRWEGMSDEPGEMDEVEDEGKKEEKKVPPVIPRKPVPALEPTVASPAASSEKKPPAIPAKPALIKTSSATSTGSSSSPPSRPAKPAGLAAKPAATSVAEEDKAAAGAPKASPSLAPKPSQLKGRQLSESSA